MKNASDGELMSQIAKGSQKAFQEIYRRYSPHVLGYARRLLRDRGTADEVSQEAWIKIVRGAASYRGDGTVKSWVYTVVRRTAMNYLRDQIPKETALSTDDASNEATISDFEHEVLARAEVDEVRSAVADLPDSQRVALTLWLTEEMSYEDIGRELGVSEGAVKQLLHRARQTLQAKVRRGA